MMSSLESQTLENCTTALETFFSGLDREIIHDLKKENFITEQVRRDVLDARSMLSVGSKAGMIVQAIADEVALDKAKFHAFLAYLKRKGKTSGCSAILNILTQEFIKLGGVTLHNVAEMEPSRPDESVQHPPTGGAATTPQKSEFRENFTPSELYDWLRSHQVPEKDCKEIKSNDIGGLVFKLTTEADGWGEYNITKPGMTLIKMHLKKMLKSSVQSDLVVGGTVMGGSAATGTPQASEQASVPQQPSQQEPSILDEIDGSTKLIAKDQAELQRTIDQLSPDDVFQLGVKLGLTHVRMSKMSRAGIDGEMIHKWLLGTDNTMDVDPVPSWRAFARGLLAIKEEGIVKAIRQAHPRR